MATYSSFIEPARSMALASVRVSAAEAPGCWTVLPLARGSAFIAASARAVSSAASTPALATRLRAVPSSWRSSATSRWIGSVAVLPAVVAESCAASMTSRLRVVNFSAPNWLNVSPLCSVSVLGDHCGPTSANTPEVESIPLNSRRAPFSHLLRRFSHLVRACGGHTARRRAMTSIASRGTQPLGSTGRT